MPSLPAALLVPALLIVGCTASAPRSPPAGNRDPTDQASVDLWRASLLAGDKGLVVAGDLARAFGLDPDRVDDPALLEALEEERADGAGLLGARKTKLVAALIAKGERRRQVIEDEWGLTLQGDQVVGLLAEERRDPTTGDTVEIAVMGCAACHAGKANGKVYLGLGNKTVDVWRMGEDAAHAIPTVQALRGRPVLAKLLGLNTSPLAHRFDGIALEFAERLAHDPWMNQAQGLVPTSLVFWWFHTVGSGGFPDAPPRGEVKVPSWWGYANRRGVDGGGTGLFCDGFGTGPGWPGGAELGGGPALEDIATAAFKQRVGAIEKSLAAVNAPPWPVDRPFPAGNVGNGRALFHGDVYRCSKCHGDDGKGFVGEGRKSVGAATIGTDPARLEMTTTGPYAKQYQKRVREVGSMAGLEGWFSFAMPMGYVAPRLDGIWARFPYLHNGSVPTLRALLSPPERRPAAFDLSGAGETWRFDPVDVGLDVRCFNGAKDGRFTCRSAAELQRLAGDPGAFPTEARFIYDSRRAGMGNGGHYFKSWPAGGLPEPDQNDLLAYLATL